METVNDDCLSSHSILELNAPQTVRESIIELDRSPMQVQILNNMNYKPPYYGFGYKIECKPQLLESFCETVTEFSCAHNNSTSSYPPYCCDCGNKRSHSEKQYLSDEKFSTIIEEKRIEDDSLEKVKFGFVFVPEKMVFYLYNESDNFQTDGKIGLIFSFVKRIFIFCLFICLFSS